MTDDTRSPNRTFSETEMRRVLSRAAELELSAGGSITAADLRRIATDAGIDPAAFDQAVKEVDQPETRARGRSDLVRVLTLKNLGMVVAGSVLCSLSFAADGGHLGSFTALGIFGPTAAFTAWRAFHHRWRGSLRELITELGIMFASFTAMAYTLGGLGGVEAALVFTVVLGWAGIAIANRPGARGQLSDIATPSKSP